MKVEAICKAVRGLASMLIAVEVAKHLVCEAYGVDITEFHALVQQLDMDKLGKGINGKLSKN